MKTSHKYTDDDCIFSRYYHQNEGDEWCGLGFGYRYSLYHLPEPGIYLLKEYTYNHWDGGHDSVNYYESATLEGVLLDGYDAYHKETKVTQKEVAFHIINTLEEDEHIGEDEADKLRDAVKAHYQALHKAMNPYLYV